jgi:hypothetical protein
MTAFARPLCGAVILLLIAACTTRPTEEAVAKFSVALDGASTSVQQGLTEIQRQETAANDAAEAERFIRQNDPNLRFGRNANITDAVIAPRLAFFAALSEYASSLAAAVSDEQIESVRAQFAATGEAFSELGSKVAAASGKTFPSDLAGQVSQAAANIAAFMVEQKLNREIPTIVSGVHENLKAGVDAFKADLGDPASGGFRAIMNDSIEVLVGQKTKLLIVLKQEGTTPKADLYNSVLRAQAEVRKLRQSERLLAAIPPALDRLLEAHEALKTPDSPVTLAKVEVFLARAKELQAIANSLES